MALPLNHWQNNERSRQNPPRRATSHRLFYDCHRSVSVSVSFVGDLVISAQPLSNELIYHVWWKLKNPVHDVNWHKIPWAFSIKQSEDKLKRWKENDKIKRQWRVLPQGEQPGDEDE
jgi:hypothetical protein